MARGNDKQGTAVIVKRTLIGACAVGAVLMFAKELPGLIREVKIWRM